MEDEHVDMKKTGTEESKNRERKNSDWYRQIGVSDKIREKKRIIFILKSIEESW